MGLVSVNGGAGGARNNTSPFSVAGAWFEMSLSPASGVGVARMLIRSFWSSLQ